MPTKAELEVKIKKLEAELEESGGGVDTGKLAEVKSRISRLAVNPVVKNEILDEIDKIFA